MGDSSVSCVLSGVTIYTERAVLLPLAPRMFSSNRSQPRFDKGAIICTNEGASAVFAPLMLPIFGRMNGYGRLEDIERDTHVEFLETKLDEGIDAIAEAVAYGGTLEGVTKIAKRFAASIGRKAWDGALYGCYIHRDVWDQFSTDCWGDGGDPNESAYSVFATGWLEPVHLKGMGFTRCVKDETRATEIFGNGPHEGSRYNTPWTHPECPGLTLWCDENMSSRAVWNGKKDDYNIHTTKDLQKFLVKNGSSLPASSLEWAGNTAACQTELVKLRQKYVTALKQSRALTEMYRERPQGAFHAMVEEVLPGGKKRAKGDTTIPEGTLQTLCDGRKTHVTLIAGVGNSTTQYSLGPCDCAKRELQYDFRPHIQFTEEVNAALRANGWKPRCRTHLPNMESRHLFAPEAWGIYRTKHLREFLSSSVAVSTFLSNMNAANRILMPTNSGWQYGNFAVQLRVAQAAVKIAKAKLAKKHN